MPEISVRTRADRATLTVPCTDDTPHRIVVTSGGMMHFDSAHNPDHDAVMEALGAEPHPCQKAMHTYYAARDIYRAATGAADRDDLYLARRNAGTVWQSRTPCQHCSRWTYPSVASAALTHLNSPSHLAAVTDSSESAIRTLVRWMVRHSRRPDLFTRDGEPTLSRSAMGEFRLPERNPWPHLWITDNYLHAAAALGLYGDSRDDFIANVRALRAGGVKVQWLTGLVNSLPQRTRDRLRNEPISVSALVGARNLAPEKVARYINAGIRANYYTYARVNAQPEQVLAYYRATGERRTLADDLRSGITIPDALARISS